MGPFGQTYVGIATLAGVPAVGTLPGFVVFDFNRFELHDSFRNADQIDEDSDVVRSTPYAHNRIAVVEFWPFVDDFSGLDLPEPGSLMTVGQRNGPPLPIMFAGGWRYIGPGSASLHNEGVMSMTMTMRKCNPFYTPPA